MKLKGLQTPFKIGFAAVLAAIVVFGFQNCGKVSIHAKPSTEPISLSTTDFKATACPKSLTLPAEATKFIFVMDMSVSNIGAWDKIGNYFYFLKDKGTDREGARFDALKSFIDTCGGTTTGNQFSVIAFANTAGRVESKLVSGEMQKTLTCDGGFKDRNAVKADIDMYKAQQLLEIPEYEKYIYPNPYPQKWTYQGVLGATNYGEALGCVENTITSDLRDPNKVKTAENYQVFFISDGRPKDANKTFCEDTTLYKTQEDRDKCYDDGISKHVQFTMQAALGYNKNIKFHALYYRNKNYTETPEDKAAIEKYMGSISNLGNTNKPVVIDSFADGSINPLCKLLGMESSVEFRPDLIRVINLSAKRVNGELIADSDMDGLTDPEEDELGTDPLNPRSINSKVLDGICMRIGSKAACDTAIQSSNCSPVPNRLGVSKCDLVALQIDKLYNHPDFGIDTDKDGMPDIAEIIKGTDPGSADMHMDLDGDGLANSKEILEGRDISAPDANLSAEKLIDTKLAYRGTYNGCGYGAWELSISSMPGAPTVAFTPTTSDDSLRLHNEGENVFLIFYRSDPRNSGQYNIEYWQNIFRVNYQPISGTASFRALPSQSEILPNDFIKTGEVAP